MPPDAHRASYEWNEQRDKPIMTATFPIHPLSSLQAPFEESMLDATGETGHVPFLAPQKGVKTRQHLLCRDEAASEPSYNSTYHCHWRNHPKAKFHPLTKTVAQIIFGLHLLHQHLEKSVADVADILLKHVNELDSFLQRANEDLDASLKDMLFRHKCLKVPMEHVHEFDRLLEDRAYRAQLLDGNIVIERTIARMSGLLNDYLADINTFRDAIHHIDSYLLHIGHDWTHRNDDIGRIYSAMRGNTGGWSQFLQSLVAKAEKLGVVLVQVSSYCNEIEKRCGAASRRSLIATRTSSRNSSHSRENGRNFRTFANNKPLPTPPSERPPFVLSPNIASHHPSTSRARLQADAVHSDSTLETPKQSEDSSSTSATSIHDVQVRHGRGHKQPEHGREPRPDQDHRRESSQADSNRTSRLAEHQRDPASVSNQGGEVKWSVSRRISKKQERGEPSPPWSANDSAYSSVSGASAMSPTRVSPRSASSMSSRTAQFGLFPSRNLSTPKGSVSGRHGAPSPVFSQTSQGSKPADMPSRPPTSMSTRSEVSSKRMSKRNSFSSLKRFFSKKKTGEIATITE